MASKLVFARVGDSKLAKVDQACCKEAFSSLMTLILEAARTDTDAAGLGCVRVLDAAYLNSFLPLTFWGCS